MRVFIGISLSSSVKEALFELRKQLEDYCLKGNFTPVENFHLTVQFIGNATEREVEQLKAVIAATAEETKSFDIRLNHLGEFPKKRRAVIWAGPNRKFKLKSLYSKLHTELSRQELKINHGKYTPHFTLGRNLLLKESFEKIQDQIHWNEIPVKIDNITLFESIRINDKLVYRPLVTHQLKE